MNIVVIIPTYNEKENIERLLGETLKVLGRDKVDKYFLLVVDDNSPDGTGGMVRNFASKYKNIKLLSGKKRGLGNAMIRGYKFALKNLKPDLIVSTEADFAYDPKYIRYAVGKIKEGFDVAVASRHIGEAGVDGWTLTRKINHWVANQFFATWVAGVSQIKDHNGAFRAIRVGGVLDKINWDDLDVSGFGFFNYFLFKLTRVTDKFYEFPVTYRFRKKGESKISFNPRYFGTYLRDVLEYIKLSFQIRLEKSRINI